MERLADIRLTARQPQTVTFSHDCVCVLLKPSKIPNKSFEHDSIEAPFFADGALPMFVQIEPQATLRELQVSFPIQDYRYDYHVKPVAYLGNLVGHEGVRVVDVEWWPDARSGVAWLHRRWPVPRHHRHGPLGQSSARAVALS